jgi:predicted dehydrogenase
LLADGGSFFDLRLYPLNVIRWFADEEPCEYRAFVSTRNTSGTFAAVEQTVSWMMKFPSGILASCGSSYGQSGTSYLQINGTAGHICLEPALTYVSVVLKYTGKTQTGDIEGADPTFDPDQFVTEATYFADCVLRNKEPETLGEEGLKDILAVEEIYKAARAPEA